MNTPAVFVPGQLDLLRGEVDTTVPNYIAPSKTIDVSPTNNGGNHWGYWAKDPSGNFLFAIEAENGDPANNQVWGHESGNRPSDTSATGTLTWTGEILGEDFNNADRFDGTIDLTMDLDAADPNLLDVSVSVTNYSGSGVPSTFSYTDVSVETDGSIDHHLGGSSNNKIEGSFYGDKHEGIAGFISDSNNDIDFSMFGAVREQ